MWLRELQRMDLIQVTNVGCRRAQGGLRVFARDFYACDAFLEITNNVSSHKLSRKKRVTRSISSRRAGPSLTP
jgi:hypothetical protein